MKTTGSAGRSVAAASADARSRSGTSVRRLTSSLAIRRGWTKKRLFEVIGHAAMLTYVFATLYPLVWVFFSSFKTNREIIERPWGLPTSLRFDNYVQAWSGSKVGTFFWNSLYVSTIAGTATVLLAAMTAFAITRMRCGRLNKAVSAVFLFGLLVPAGSLLVPLYMLLRELHLYNTPLALLFPYAAFGLPLTMFVIAAFFKSVPGELEEAGVVDGLGAIGLFARVVLPISVPTLVTVFILNFLSNWNEFIMANLFLAKEKYRTLPVGMVAFYDQLNMNYGGLCAAIMFSVLPVVALYAVLQQKIIEGITAGSVKG